MGFVARGPESVEVAATVIDYIYARFLEGLELDSFNLKDIELDPKLKVEMMADLSRLDVSLRELTAAFTVPKEWILLERTLLLLMGLCTHLDPEMKPVTVLRPHVQRFFLGDRDWMEIARGVVKDLALSAFTLPEEVRRVLKMAREGELRMQVNGLQEGAQLLYVASQQLLWAVLALGSGALALWARFEGETRISFPLSGVAGFFLLCLGVSLLRGRKLQRRVGRRRVSPLHPPSSPRF